MKPVHSILNFKTPIGTIVVFEGLVFLLSYAMKDDTIQAYQYAARFSARASFILLVGILIWIAVENLNIIWKNHHKLKLFKSLIILFSTKHVIHLVYLSATKFISGSTPFQRENIPGALVYCIAIALPFYAVKIKTVTKKLAYVSIALLIISFVFAITYWNRILSERQDLSPKALYKLFFVTILILIVINIYQTIKIFLNEIEV